MAQNYPTIDASVPGGDSGATLATKLNQIRATLLSTNSGATEPAYKAAGTLWIDNSGSPWTLKLYDGADWIPLFQVNPATNLPIYASDATLAAAVVSLAALSAAFKAAPLIAANIGSPAEKTYPLVLKMKEAMKIKGVTTKCASGTCTLTVTVDGTPIDGSANSVSSSETTQAHDQTVAIGQTVAFAITSNAACVDLSCDIDLERVI